ncbi:glycosylase [Primorskyibacter flagellatus]|uniref:Glycosylase n=1 Tax=Primorskyibacter flagellatus TaxID=1387277 RepID=A0A917A2L3_9RHOB|nr:VOC family protein [Primorskyibacter flagellatus]GGE23285.1 glycosylase [Primorskyibacter flagellatus]
MDQPLSSQRAEALPQVTPYLVTSPAREAIAFYTAAFTATEDFRMTDPVDGRIGHAELNFGTTRIMLADEYPEVGALCPDSIGGSPVTLHLMVADVDATVAHAATLGGTVLRAPADQSFGERNALLLDPFGHRWMIAQMIEEVTPEEMQARWNDSADA